MNAITPEEQKAIDDFLAKKGVTHVPRGTSGLPQFIWHEEKGAQAQLRQMNPDGTLRTREQMLQDAKRQNVTDFKVTARRSKIRGLAPDMTPKQIAEHLCVPIHTVRTDLKIMKVKAALEPDAIERNKKKKKNRAAVKRAMKTCKTVEEVQKATGLSKYVTARHMAALANEGH